MGLAGANLEGDDKRRKLVDGAVPVRGDSGAGLLEGGIASTRRKIEGISSSERIEDGSSSVGSSWSVHVGDGGGQIAENSGEVSLVGHGATTVEAFGASGETALLLELLKAVGNGRSREEEGRKEESCRNQEDEAAKAQVENEWL